MSEKKDKPRFPERIRAKERRRAFAAKLVRSAVQMCKGDEFEAALTILEAAELLPSHMRVSPL